MATAPRYHTGRAHGLSDGVFAIAMTLLVLDLKVPNLAHGQEGRLPAALAAQAGAYFAYALSFYVVGRLWLGHHRLFRHVTEADDRLLRLNLLVLLFVGVLPFPTALLGRYGSEKWGVVPYAAVMTVMEALLATMWWWAGREGLLDEEGTAGVPVAIARTLGLGAVMLISIPVAFVRPDIAKYLWILLLVSSRVAARMAGHRPGTRATEPDPA